MKQFYFAFRLFLVLTITSISCNLSAQTCSLNISTVTSDSRCKATGSIIVTVTGGSGSYNYTVTGAGYTTSTSTNIIDGLKPGVYSVKVKDITNGCTIDENNISVGGNYQDPRFNLAVTDVSCVNASNGSITVNNLQYGQGPYTYPLLRLPLPVPALRT